MDLALDNRRGLVSCASRELDRAIAAALAAEGADVMTLARNLAGTLINGEDLPRAAIA